MDHLGQQVVWSLRTFQDRATQCVHQGVVEYCIINFNENKSYDETRRCWGRTAKLFQIEKRGNWDTNSALEWWLWSESDAVNEINYIYWLSLMVVVMIPFGVFNFLLFIIIRADMADGSDGQQPHNSWKFNLLFSIWLPHQQRLRIFECSLIEKDERAFMKKAIKTNQVKVFLIRLYSLIISSTSERERMNIQNENAVDVSDESHRAYIRGRKIWRQLEIHFWCSIYKSSRQCDDDDCLFEQRINSQNWDWDDNKVLRYTLTCGNDWEVTVEPRWECAW